ncbi:MAG: metallophosphoesterase family protein [Candidatus Omnitrophota bacterium]
MSIKIGVISDTHIPERAKTLPKKILDDFSTVDMIIHAGDFIDIEVLHKLQNLAKVIAVAGNMDFLEIKNELKEQEIIKVGDVKIAITHGFGPPNELVELLKKAFKKEKPNAIIFGHSHQPMNEIIDGTLFFNPGSPTDKIFSPYNSYGILEIKGKKITGKIIKL